MCRQAIEGLVDPDCLYSRLLWLLTYFFHTLILTYHTLTRLDIHTSFIYTYTDIHTSIHTHLTYIRLYVRTFIQNILRPHIKQNTASSTAAFHQLNLKRTPSSTSGLQPSRLPPSCAPSPSSWPASQRPSWLLLRPFPFPTGTNLRLLALEAIPLRRSKLLSTTGTRLVCRGEGDQNTYILFTVLLR